MEDFELQAQFQPGMQIQMQPNSAASKWTDLCDLIQAQDVDVYDSDGELSCEAFLEAVEEAKVTAPHTGVSWRWMIAVAEGGTKLEMQLQSLPCSGSAIRSNPVLCLDNVATTIIARYPIDANYWDGYSCCGPVPVLFSSKPEETAKAFKDMPAEAHDACQQLAAKLLRTENISAKDAMEYVKSPKEGRSTKPMTRVWNGGASWFQPQQQASSQGPA